MRAAVCREFGRPLVVEDVEIDAPGPGEVLVDVAACAICHSDVTFIDGDWGGELPAVYGHEAAGTIAETGPGVTGLSPGDKAVVSLIRSCGSCFYCRRGEPAFCTGTFGRDRRSPLTDGSGAEVGYGLQTAAFAEQVVVHESQIARVPADMALDSASLLACGVITGVGAILNTAKVEPGSSVVVIGIGGVGVNALQGARLAGAERIIAVDVVDEKLHLARRFGATETLDGRRADLADAVRELTAQRGADYVVASVGAAPVMERAVSLCRRGGTAVLVGIPPIGATMTLDAIAVPDDGLRILGSKMGAAVLEDDVAKMVGYYREGSLLLDELISSRRPLEEINDAIDEVRTGSALRSVILL